MEESTFEELSTHLERLCPAFEHFCSKHGFSFAERRSIGRYPRVRIEKIGAVTIYFDLWMCVDADGNRHKVFFESNPYDLTAGAYTDCPDPPYGVRYQTGFIIWDRIPFSSIDPISLVDVMEAVLPQLNDWTIPSLRLTGTVVMLPKSGRSGCA